MTSKIKYEKSPYITGELKKRDELRNVAIIAHVDHGKTTLVDAMLTQSGAFSEHQKEGEDRDRVMDSMDLEREKGITILAKNTSIRRGAQTVNIIDTPGHADFGGEVERGLEMVDGVILLVDASEGPLPQTRFVLRKALEKNLPVILVINKVDRPDSRINEVVDEAYGLFLDLDANDDQIEFPVVYASAKAGRASMNRPGNGEMPDRENLDALFEVIFNTIPAPVYHEGAPLQAHVTNLDSSPYLGRLALCRIREGVIKKGENVMWMKTDGTSERVKISELLITNGLERVPALEAGPGDIVAIAGIETITLGETLADLERPHALPKIIVDEPSISMTIGINTSPLAGQEGKLLTARQVKNRLDAELIGNVSLRVVNTDRPDTWEVQGRGEFLLPADGGLDDRPLAILQDQDFFLHRVAGDELIAGHDSGLANPVGAIRRLVFHGRIPPGIKMYHGVRPGQVQPHAAGFQADEEHGDPGPGLKALHDGGAVGGGTVEITKFNLLLRQPLF